MPRFIRVLTLTSTMLALAAFATAQASSTPAAPKKPAATEAAKKPAKAAGAHSSLVAAGKLAKFDASTNMLTVTTATGDVMFTITPSVKIQEGSKTLGVDNLAADAGRSVRVTYTDKGGTKTAESVHVMAAATPKVTKAKKS